MFQPLYLIILKVSSNIVLFLRLLLGWFSASTNSTQWPNSKIPWSPSRTGCKDYPPQWNCSQICYLPICSMSMSCSHGLHLLIRSEFYFWVKIRLENIKSLLVSKRSVLVYNTIRWDNSLVVAGISSAAGCVCYGVLESRSLTKQLQGQWWSLWIMLASMFIRLHFTPGFCFGVISWRVIILFVYL